MFQGCNVYSNHVLAGFLCFRISNRCNVYSNHVLLSVETDRFSTGDQQALIVDPLELGSAEFLISGHIPETVNQNSFVEAVVVDIQLVDSLEGFTL